MNDMNDTDTDTETDTDKKKEEVWTFTSCFNCDSGVIAHLNGWYGTCDWCGAT